MINFNSNISLFTEYLKSGNLERKSIFKYLEYYEKAKISPVIYKFCLGKWKYINKFILSLCICIRLSCLEVSRTEWKGQWEKGRTSVILITIKIIFLKKTIIPLIKYFEIQYVICANVFSTSLLCIIFPIVFIRWWELKYFKFLWWVFRSTFLFFIYVWENYIFHICCLSRHFHAPLPLWKK